MSEIFLASVKKLTEQNLTTSELIESADALRANGQVDSAIQLYKLWISLNAGNPYSYAAYFNSASLLSAMGNISAAKEALEHSIRVHPDFFPAYINLGNALENLGFVDEAIAQWSALVDRLAVVTGTAIEYKTMALKQISRIQALHGRPALAEAALRQSLEINQNQSDVVQQYAALRIVQCQWPIISPSEGISRKTLIKGMSPLSLSVYTDDPILQLAAASNHNKNTFGYPLDNFHDKHRTQLASQRGRRRIGYVSSDIRDHAVGYALPEVFELHNRDEFEIFLYYCGPVSKDPVQARTKAAIDHWVDITGLDNRTIAQRIVTDGIDILVDVNGYTKDAYTGVFALRPAPIIVNWFGYPGTMGSPYHHYIIADDWIVPKDSEIYYSERVMRLPCYQPNDRKRVILPQKYSRADLGLPEDVTVFCCFNSVHKITRFTFDRWMTILSRVPDSVLWLLEGDENSQAKLRNFAAAYGVSSERIVFAPRLNNSYHLARYPLADLFLDTSPYGAHVTASDALWMGVPILTLSGRGFASRVCGSLTQAAGLPEMVCSTPQEYVERAVSLGMDRNKIQQLKKRLADNRDSCALFNMNGLVSHLELAYNKMWSEFQRGQLPQPDLTNLDIYLEIGCEQDHEATEMLTVDNYHEIYKDKLAAMHKYYPLHEDQRLWKALDRANSDENFDLTVKLTG